MAVQFSPAPFVEVGNFASLHTHNPFVIISLPVYSEGLYLGSQFYSIELREGLSLFQYHVVLVTVSL